VIVNSIDHLALHSNQLKPARSVQAALHFFKAHRLLGATLGSHGEIVQVFHELLVPFHRKDDTGLIALGIDDKLLLNGHGPLLLMLASL